MGILDYLLGKPPSTKYDIEQCQQQGLAEMLQPEMLQPYDFRGMAAQRMGHGFEPIDWPKIISNQFRALALTRPLTMIEQFAYDGALQALNKDK